LFNASKSHHHYWNQYWNNYSYLNNLLQLGKAGNLGEFKHIILKYINKEKLTLEAGCGPGHMVAGLTTNGYKAIGIDYEPMVVKYANQQLPNENITEGNVLALNLPDASLGCYLSIGVVEHFINGPQPALLEARRLLTPDGIALISVPYLNPSRCTYLSTLNEISMELSNYRFHQYYFSIEDFSKELSIAGFKVLEWYPYAVQAFLTREHFSFIKFWNHGFMRYPFQKIILRLLVHSPRSIRNKYGHMVMFVCRPV